MKTLNTLLALALLVSAVAPVCAMEEAPETATVTTPSIFARAFASAQTGAASVKDFYAFKNEDKATSFKRYGVTALAVAAVAGLGYAAYNFFTSEDEEEVVAPVEPQVSTVEPAPAVVAPVVVKPVTKKPARVNPPRKKGFRTSKCAARSARIARAKSGKTSSCNKSRKSSCKPCQA